VLAQTVDVSDEEQVISGVARAVAEFGRLDCVVVNAGVSTKQPSFLDLDTETYHDLLAVSQHGSYYTLREGVRHMVARAEAGDPGGSIIVCGSLALYRGVPGGEHYAAAKAATLAIARGAAVEYGKHGIRVNVVAPGWVETNLGGASPEQIVLMREHVASRNPIPRTGTPADFEGVAVYLMSDASAYHTGDVLVLDGGWSVTL
jgi:NAD(P)-dependent dehydrogenase (short-subunit alcohol dehydrogenase family)